MTDTVAVVTQDGRMNVVCKLYLFLHPHKDCFGPDCKVLVLEEINFLRKNSCSYGNLYKVFKL
jgi:hypothetical protein